MVQWVKHLARKYEDLSSSPQYSLKFQAQWCTCNTSIEGWEELGGPRGVLASCSIQTDNSRSSKKPCLKKEGRE